MVHTSLVEGEHHGLQVHLSDQAKQRRLVKKVIKNFAHTGNRDQAHFSRLSIFKPPTSLWSSSLHYQQWRRAQAFTPLKNQCFSKARNCCFWLEMTMNRFRFAQRYSVPCDRFRKIQQYAYLLSNLASILAALCIAVISTSHFQEDITDSSANSQHLIAMSQITEHITNVNVVCPRWTRSATW